MLTFHQRYELTVDEHRALAKIHSSRSLKWLPEDVRPYAELIRLHKPAGLMAFYFPCLYGSLLVGILRPTIPWLSMTIANLKLLVLSFFMRCVFVTLNDLVDQDFDRQVSRTRIRPIARGAVSTRNAVIWNVILLAILGGAFALLPPQCTIDSLPFILLHTLYPFAKRWTHHPQFILGLVFNHGTFAAVPILNQHFDLWRLNGETLAVYWLSAAILLWSMLCDVIYSAQDVDDDIKAGVGSPVVYWGSSSKLFLRALGVLTILSFVMVLRTTKESVGTSSSIAAGVFLNPVPCSSIFFLGLMVERVKLDDPSNCGWWFNRGSILVGFAIGVGLLVKYSQ